MLPEYQCIKKVRAAKIVHVTELKAYPEYLGGTVCAFLLLLLPNGSHVFVAVDGQYLTKHQPTAGGYYVCYEDGYTSFSPKEAFEKGYLLCDPTYTSPAVHTLTPEQLFDKGARQLDNMYNPAHFPVVTTSATNSTTEGQ